MLLLLQNAYATALLNRVMNLVKEAVEHLNPTPVLTMDQPLSAIAKDIQWVWPDSFSNNKYVITIGGGGGRGAFFYVGLAGRMVEWFWVAKCNHNCWNTVAESFLKASYLTCAYSAAKCLHFLCVV